MFGFIKKQLYKLKSKNSKRADMQIGFENSVHDIPLPNELEAMSVTALAELLASATKDSVEYIVLSHALSVKIAKLQAKATLNAGWLGAVATIVAVLISIYLGYYIGKSKSEVINQPVSQPATTCNCTQSVTSPLAAKKK